MLINIYKDKLLGARLFGASVLYSTQPIPREDVPQGWYCYDLRGTARRPDEPHALVDRAEEDHVGSILSRLPLKNGRSQYRLVKNMFQMTGTNSTLAEFCAAENVHCPEVPLRYQMCPASPEEAGLFYAQTPEKDEEMGAIGHVRIDFGSGGTGFYHTWWPRGPEESNTQEFRDELDKVVNDLRKGILKDLPSMRRYCCGSEGAIEGGSCCQNYGFTLETERYLYRLRCNPIEGDYQAYLSCFDKQAQQMGLTEKGRQALSDAADPTLLHSYYWYVIEHINTPERKESYELPLEEAIPLYASLDCEDKRLGVTKDDIAAVDLVICWEGREWLSHDRLKMEEFKDDPVLADAVGKLQQMLDESQAVGRVTFASGERWNFTDPQKYLQAVREELPFQSATGFHCETLTDDPEIRKAVDDMICDLYGEENPLSLADYGGTGEGIRSDNTEQTDLPQPEAKNSCTLDEFLAAIEPQYREYKNTMRQCIAGLTEHAARLAAQDQEEFLPLFRRLCIEMSEFWGLTEDDTPRGYQEMAEHFGSVFDNAVSAARDSGHAPELSEQTKQNILDGLELYAQEMRANDDQLEDWAVECEILAEDLEEHWQSEAAAPQQTAPQMGGMNG